MAATTSLKAPRIVKNSVLRHAEWAEDGSTRFWKPTELPDFTSATDDVTYTVVEGDRIDLLANTFYGDSRLLWVILWANDMVLPDIELVPGLKLRVPSRSRLLNKLLKGG